MTREEFKKTVKRILTEAGAKVTKESWCKEIYCNHDDDCPFSHAKFCMINDESVDKLFNTLEYVEQWAKDHPIVTMAEKYEEVFGAEPKDKYGCFVCPHFVGFANVECARGSGYIDCTVCTAKFWCSEYEESKKEGES